MQLPRSLGSLPCGLSTFFSNCPPFPASTHSARSPLARRLGPCTRPPRLTLKTLAPPPLCHSSLLTIVTTGLLYHLFSRASSCARDPAPELTQVRPHARHPPRPAPHLILRMPSIALPVPRPTPHTDASLTCCDFNLTHSDNKVSAHNRQRPAAIPARDALCEHAPGQKPPRKM